MFVNFNGGITVGFKTATNEKDVMLLKRGTSKKIYTPQRSRWVMVKSIVEPIDTLSVDSNDEMDIT